MLVHLSRSYTKMLVHLNRSYTKMLGLFHSSGRFRIPKDNGFHQFFALKLGGILFLLCRKILQN